MKEKRQTETQLGGFLGQEGHSLFLWCWTWVTMHLSKFTDCMAPRVHLKIRCALWVITNCQCWFVSCNKYTTWMQDGDSGEVCVWGGVEYLGTLHFPPDFVVSLKPPLKRLISFICKTNKYLKCDNSVNSKNLTKLSFNLNVNKLPHTPI